MPPRILATSIAALLVSTALHAQTWDGGGANGGNLNWSFANNWTPNGAPLNNGNANIVFGRLFDTNPGPNLDQNWSVNSVTFSNTAGAFTLGPSGGFTLTVGGGGIVNQDAQAQTINHAITLAAPQTWSATSGGLNFGSGTISTNGSALTLNGAGSLIVIDGAITGSESLWT